MIRNDNFERPTSRNPLFEHLHEWKSKRKFPLDLLSDVDLEAFRTWPEKRELLIQSLLMTSCLITLFLMTMCSCTPSVYCLGTLVISIFQWQRWHETSDGDSKTRMALIFAGFLSHHCEFNELSSI